MRQVEQVGKMELPSKKQNDRLLQNKSSCHSMYELLRFECCRDYSGPVSGWSQQQAKVKQKHESGAVPDVVAYHS